MLVFVEPPVDVDNSITTYLEMRLLVGSGFINIYPTSAGSDPRITSKAPTSRKLAANRNCRAWTDSPCPVSES